MPDHFLYLLVDAGCLIFPLLFSFHPKIRFYREAIYFLIPCFITSVVFIGWDMIFTHWEIWQFNSRYITGRKLFNLPAEEILFFICIPYACVFTYFCLKKFFRFPSRSAAVNVFTVLLIIFLLVTGFLNIERLYTSVTFIATAVFLLFLLFLRVDFLPAFYVSFVAILPFFFLSNGILTGSFIDEPVVSYNDAHNLGIRMFTIPFEDTFYGMLLLLLNVSGYEWVRRKSVPVEKKSPVT